MMGPVNDKQVDALQKATRSARHLLELINDVLDISKMEAGRLELYVEENVDLYLELDTVIDTTKTLIKENDVELLTDFAEDLPVVTCDRRRIRQVLLNLTSNAAKFTNTGRIVVRAWHESQKVLFSVQDTGVGIAPEDHDVIFEPFQQSSSAEKRIPGTGLGLPISKRLVEAHGGQIWLESAPGEGSTFYFSIPVRSQVLADSGSTSETVQQQTGIADRSNLTDAVPPAGTTEG